MQIQSSSSTIFNAQSIKDETLNDSEQNSYFNFFDIKDYNDIFKEALDTKTDTQKNAHIQSLTLLKEKGLKEDELNMINTFVILENKEKLDEFYFSEEDKKIIENYQSIFNKIYQAIQEEREVRLQFKKLQAQTMMTDVLLKSKDNQDGIQSPKHTLNIEV